MLFYDSRADMINQLIQPGQVLCEIGVFRCDFANELLKTKPSKLVLIDPWQGVTMSGDMDGNNVVYCNLDEVYLDVEKAVKHLPNVQVHRGLSTAELVKYPNHYFDFIYIDGDHSYSGCKSDLLLSWQKIKPGGIIAGHDYEMNFAKAQNNYEFGVKQAVDEFCNEYQLSLMAKAMDGCVSYAIRVPIDHPNHSKSTSN